MAGRSIKIFLVDGSPTGLRTAEIGLSTIKAMVIPEASRQHLKKRPEPQKTGVYILIGTDPDSLNQKRIYIGEGDTVIKRINDHTKDDKKGLWEEAVIFVAKDENLTKAHVRYLEARLISLAIQAKRSNVLNVTEPKKEGKLPEADEVEMEEFIAQAILLSGALGYDIFEQPTIVTAQADLLRPSHKETTFESRGDGYEATCFVDVNTGRYIVKSGSTVRKQETPSFPESTRRLRLQLVSKGILSLDGEKSYRFNQNYSFSSISAAAQVVLGSSVNGKTFWQNESGTYAEWQESKINAEEEPDIS